MTMQQVTQAEDGSFLVRPFTMDNYEQVIDLWLRSGIRIGPSDSREGIASRLRRDEDLFLVAVNEQGRVIGAVLGGFDGRRGWANHLAVEPVLHLRGIGKVLLAQLEERLRARGCLKLNLLVAGDNTQVLGFYERQGYQTSNVVFMEKWLD